MSKLSMWIHHCEIKGNISFAVGCVCDWCGATQSSESAYCAYCGLLANELHDELCASCHNKARTIDLSDNAIGREAADVSSVDGFNRYPNPFQPQCIGQAERKERTKRKEITE